MNEKGSLRLERVNGLWCILTVPQGYIRKIFDSEAQAKRYMEEKNNVI